MRRGRGREGAQGAQWRPGVAPAAYAFTRANRGKAAAADCAHGGCDVVLTDVGMDHRDELTIREHVRRRQHHAEVVAITGYGDVKTVVEGMKLGPSHYHQQP